ncbi:hypothetical protein [Lentibacillus sp.]|uniref:hypothetical protein n=1 Tax=Lentibacillus sp. TaxID=1925746 RepID=UPI002B4B92B1|nr:hypothetical protein [Lentibacillus sp.]HLS07845.1 hypothetical protein [Lentibacillus sp.]
MSWSRPHGWKMLSDGLDSFPLVLLTFPHGLGPISHGSFASSLGLGWMSHVSVTFSHDLAVLPHDLARMTHGLRLLSHEFGRTPHGLRLLSHELGHMPRSLMTLSLSLGCVPHVSALLSYDLRRRRLMFSPAQNHVIEDFWHRPKIPFTKFNKAEKTTS